MARSTFKILFYVNKSKIKADGTTNVMCRITIDGKNSSISTGVSVPPDGFKAEESRELMALKERIEQSYTNIIKTQGAVTAEMLKNCIIGVNTTPTTLMKAGEAERERLRLRAIEINSRSTYSTSGYTHKYLREFLHYRGVEDMDFRDITLSFGEEYRLFLLSTGISNSYVNTNLAWLNRLIYIAVDQDIIRCNPLEDLEYCKSNKPKLSHLTREQMQKILDTPLPYERQELVRRAFIFSCFTALSYVDVLALYPHNIFKTSAGRLYIKTNRKKTNIEAYIPLHPIAEQIILMYNTTDNNKPIFPMPNKKAVWYDLQEVAFRAGLSSGISYHQSRHCFGTLAMSEGMPVESISKIMGHSKISSTQIYAKITEEKIAKDMNKLIEKRRQLNR